MCAYVLAAWSVWGRPRGAAARPRTGPSCKAGLIPACGLARGRKGRASRKCGCGIRAKRKEEKDEKDGLGVDAHARTKACKRLLVERLQDTKRSKIGDLVPVHVGTWYAFTAM